MRFTHHEFLALAEKQAQLCLTWRKFFERYDVILCPIMPTVAFPHDQTGEGRGTSRSTRAPRSSMASRFLIMNGLQWPGLVTVAEPAGDGDLQPDASSRACRWVFRSSARISKTARTLRFAQLAEAALGGFVPPPPAMRSN